MKQYLPLILLMVMVFQAAGCSTIMGRHHDDDIVFFDANEEGVEVLCSGKRTRTPGSIPLRQSKHHACLAEKDGFRRKNFRVRSGMSWGGFGHSTATNTAAWGWWTFGIGTGIGWLVDLPSGAMRSLKDENIYIDMEPITDSLPETETALFQSKGAVKTV